MSTPIRLGKRHAHRRTGCEAPNASKQMKGQRMKRLFALLGVASSGVAILMSARMADAQQTCGVPECHDEIRCDGEEVYPCGSNPDGTVFFCSRPACRIVTVCVQPPCRAIPNPFPESPFPTGPDRFPIPFPVPRPVPFGSCVHTTLERLALERDWCERINQACRLMAPLFVGARA